MKGVQGVLHVTRRIRGTKKRTGEQKASENKNLLTERDKYQRRRKEERKSVWGGHQELQSWGKSI